MNDKIRVGDRYWICSYCANERGGKWPDGHVATVAQLTCGYCDGKNQAETFVAPYVDYDWPNLSTEHLRD